MVIRLRLNEALLLLGVDLQHDILDVDIGATDINVEEERCYLRPNLLDR